MPLNISQRLIYMRKNEWGLSPEEMDLQRRVYEKIEAERKRRLQYRSPEISHQEQMQIAMAKSESQAIQGSQQAASAAMHDEDADLQLAIQLSKQEHQQSAAEYSEELNRAKQYSKSAYEAEERARKAQEEFEKNKEYTRYDQPYLSTYGGVTLWLCNHHELNPELDPDEHHSDKNSGGKITLDNYMTNSRL